MLPARLPGRTVRSGRKTCGDLSVGEPRVRQTGIRSSVGARAWRRMFSAMCGAGKSRHRHPERVAYFRISLPGATIGRDSSADVHSRSWTGFDLSFRFCRRVGTAPVGWLCRETVDAEQLPRQTGNKKPPLSGGGFFVLTHLDSNQERQNQNLQCYHYTMGQCFNGTNVIKKIFSTKNLR